ncbi:potassium channel family protein [Clostridium sardiniense]|uniref:potassium channel family protein n=1 Tax=Clostridium sardiniense TaxID=29369 RepID=UPI00195723F4|nr:potassium channel family protein [Clostridium sardiniense]MBM7835988.1 voltage-gated potassium channel [Clostridium sardiniense]
MGKRVHEFEFFKDNNVGIIYDLSIGVLSGFAVLVVILQFNSNLSQTQNEFLNICDNLVYILFVLDGIAKCILATDWKQFIIKNKIDYIALFPFQFLLQTNLGSVFKLLKVVTYFFRLIDNMKDFLRTTRTVGIIGSAVSITLVGSIIIYFFEREGGDIKTYGDSLWLSLVTLTTIGYGDITPKTSAGRIVAMVLMITGIGFLSMLTSTFSTYLISLKYHRDRTFIEDEDKVYIDVSDLSEGKRDKLRSYYNYLKQEKD